MGQHTSYWSCSKFADWIRGTPKPSALGWGEWDDWREDARVAHPFRYWLADVALDKLQDFVYWPSTAWDDINDYIHNRFIDRSHLINTGLTPGYYHEFDAKVLHGLFNELVDFIEIELSLLHRACHNGPRRPCRLAEWGLKHLEWEMSLKHGDDDCCKPGERCYGNPTPQAVAALETKRLYEWWTVTRPNRPCPHDVVFKGEDNDRLLSLDDPYISEKYKRYCEIEEQYDREDNAYLVRLVLHRRSLWT